MRHGSKASRRSGAAALAAVLLCAMFGASAPVAAAPAPPQQMVVAWSTYLRAGPAETSEAITEVEHDTRVAVVGCDGRWCRISGTVGDGYVDRDALYLPRTLAPEPPAQKDCVVVGQADNRGPIPTRFCSASPGQR